MGCKEETSSLRYGPLDVIDTCWLRFVLISLQVNEVDVDPLSLEEVTSAILGPVGSIVKFKVMRKVHERNVVLEFLVLRELKATQDPLFQIKCEGNKVTRSHLHLQCVQDGSTRSADQKREGEKKPEEELEMRGASTMTTSLGAEADSGTEIEIEIHVEEDTEIETEIEEEVGGCLFASGVGELPRSSTGAEMTPDPSWDGRWTVPGASSLVDVGLDVLVLEECGSSWKPCRLQLTEEGRLLLPGHSLDGKLVLWAQPQLEMYRPDMSREDFLMMGRRLCLMVEGECLTAHSRHGAINAVKAERLHVMVQDSSTRDRYSLLSCSALHVFVPSVFCPSSDTSSHWFATSDMLRNSSH